jgi:YHS domain-containing protein
MKNKSVLILATITVLAGAIAWAGGDGVVALKGYCPVAYVAMEKAVKGKPEFASEHQGQTYHFLNADAKKMFDQAPEKFLPAYDGYCATAVTQGQKLASDPTLFKVVNGRTYLFSSKKAVAMFEKDPAGVIAMADARWVELQQAAK